MRASELIDVSVDGHDVVLEFGERLRQKWALLASVETYVDGSDSVYQSGDIFWQDLLYQHSLLTKLCKWCPVNMTYYCVERS